MKLDVRVYLCKGQNRDDKKLIDFQLMTEEIENSDSCHSFPSFLCCGYKK